MKTGEGYLWAYSADRARKDAHNRDKGVSRLEKVYRKGVLTKENINKRGYNKFLNMQGNTSVSIDYEKIRQDAVWDGLKGYLTNTTISAKEVYEAYHNLWNVERSFRIAKSKIEVRPMFHFTPRRIDEVWVNFQISGNTFVYCNKPMASYQSAIYFALIVQRLQTLLNMRCDDC